jgi:hypothetical protein
MKLNVYICDACGRRVESNDWTTAAKPVSISIYVSSQNPLGGHSTNENYQSSEWKQDDVCDPCRRSLARAIAEWLDGLGAP